LFDSKREQWQENGEQTAQVLCSAPESHHLVLLFGWDNLDNARRYVQDPLLKAARQEAGVSEPLIRRSSDHHRSYNDG
jgi:hypothetical protein